MSYFLNDFRFKMQGDSEINLALKLTHHGRDS